MSSLIERQSKIRKRGCSSSSSSSLVRRYRLKRDILIGKRAGSSTPVPSWKTSTSPRSSSVIIMLKKHKVQQKLQHSTDDNGKGKEAMPVSARKLTATLCEINDDNDLKSKESKLREEEEGVALVPPKLADPSYSSISEIPDLYFSNFKTKAKPANHDPPQNSVPTMNDPPAESEPTMNNPPVSVTNEGTTSLRPLVGKRKKMPASKMKSPYVNPRKQKKP